MQMKKTALLWLFIIPVLYTTHTLTAQVTFSIPVDTTLRSSATIEAPITVRNFDRIIGAQFSLRWNPDVLSLQEIDQLGFADLSLDNHFNMKADSGWVSFLYLDLGLTGKDLPDNGVLFNLRFSVIGESGQETAISFSDFPTEREVTDTSSISTSEPIVATFQDGYLSVEGAVGTTATVQVDPQRLRITNSQPNPFQQELLLDLFFAEAGRYQVQVVDLSGREVFGQDHFWASGQQRLVLGADQFPHTGLYFIRLAGHGLTAVQKVLYTE